jgi:hypothetical protein
MVLSPLPKLSWGRAEGSKLGEGEIWGFLHLGFSPFSGFGFFTVGFM